MGEVERQPGGSSVFGDVPRPLPGFLRGLGRLVSAGDPPDAVVEAILELSRQAAGAEVAAVGRGREHVLVLTHASSVDGRAVVGGAFRPPCGLAGMPAAELTWMPATAGGRNGCVARGDGGTAPDGDPGPGSGAGKASVDADGVAHAPDAPDVPDAPEAPDVHGDRLARDVAAAGDGPPRCVAHPLVIDGQPWGVVALWSDAALEVSVAEAAVLLEALAAGIVAQLARARQQLLFREVESTAGIGAWSYTLDDRRLWWSDEVFRIHGLEPGAIEPDVDRAVECYHPDDRRTIRTMLEMAMLHGEPWDLQLRLVTAAGETRWVRARGQRIVEGGVPTRLVGTLEDVHARVLDELERERMQARLEHAINGTDDGLWDWPDMDRDEQWWSPRLLGLLGLAAGDLSPRQTSLLELVHPEDRDAFAAAVEASRAGRVAMETEVRLRTADRGWRWFLARARVTGGGPSRPLRMAGAFRDVDERRRMEAQLRARTAEIEAFLHAASHDLKSPMLTLDAFAARIEEAAPDAPREELAHAAGRIRAATARMRAIVRDLLAYGRGTRVEPRMRRLPVAALLADLRHQLAGELERASVRLETDLAVSQVLADRDQAVSVLQNLLVNAIEHGADAEGGVHVTISTRASGGGRVRLEVRDRGPGVPEDDRSRIFRPFERLRRAGAIGGGTGLGLAIVAKIAEAWGGEARVESPPDGGPGACFVVDWPGAVPPPPPAGGETDRRPVIESGPESAGNGA